MKMQIKALMTEFLEKTYIVTKEIRCPNIVEKLKSMENQSRSQKPVAPGSFRLPVSLFLCLLLIGTTILAYWNCGIHYADRMEDALAMQSIRADETSSASNACFGRKELMEACTIFQYLRVEIQLFNYFCIVDAVTILLLCWTAWNPQDGQVQSLWLFLQYMIIFVISGYGVSQIAWGRTEPFATYVLIQYWFMLIAKLAAWLYVGRKFSEVINLLTWIFIIPFGDNSCRSPDDGRSDGKVDSRDSGMSETSIGANNLNM